MKKDKDDKKTDIQALDWYERLLLHHYLKNYTWFYLNLICVASAAPGPQPDLSATTLTRSQRGRQTGFPDVWPVPRRCLAFEGISLTSWGLSATTLTRSQRGRQTGFPDVWPVPRRCLAFKGIRMTRIVRMKTFIMRIWIASTSCIVYICWVLSGPYCVLSPTGGCPPSGFDWTQTCR
jgi:hypothetical protein